MDGDCSMASMVVCVDSETVLPLVKVLAVNDTVFSFSPGILSVPVWPVCYIVLIARQDRVCVYIHSSRSVSACTHGPRSASNACLP